MGHLRVKPKRWFDTEGNHTESFCFFNKLYDRVLLFRVLILKRITDRQVDGSVQYVFDTSRT